MNFFIGRRLSYLTPVVPPPTPVEPDDNGQLASRVRISDIYDDVCWTLFEPGGLQSGLLLESDFLNFASETVSDLASDTRLTRTILCMEAESGQGLYTLPDSVGIVESLYYDLKFLPVSTQGSLAGTNPAWRSRSGVPEQWHADRQGARQITVSPKPAAAGPAGAQLLGSPMYGCVQSASLYGQSVSASANLFGTIGSIDSTVFVETTAPLFGTIGSLTGGSGNLLAVAAARQPRERLSMDSTIFPIPDIFWPYVKYGILWKIFSSDSEMKDPARAQYCAARYQEGVLLAAAITGEGD